MDVIFFHIIIHEWEQQKKSREYSAWSSGLFIYFLFASGGIDPRLAAAIRSVLYEFRSLAAKAAKASAGDVVHISCKSLQEEHALLI